MWCPICGVEYRPGFTRCPDCDAGLATSPTGPVEPELIRKDEPRVTVFVGRPDEAETARELLRRGGVTSAIAPAASDATSGKLAAVVVRSADLERALEVGGRAEWEYRPIRRGDLADGHATPTSGDDAGETADGSDGALEYDGLLRGQEPTEEEIQWFFAIARFVLLVLAVVVALILVSRALT
jgi:hypothetical protein